MITTSAAEAAISIAQELDAQRITLTPQAGTPLADLCAAATQADVVPSGDAEYVPDIALIIAAAAGFAEDGTSRHDVLLNEYADEIHVKVGEHLNYAKNVVRPVISELVDAVQSDIANLPVDKFFAMNIVRQDLPAPLGSPVIRELLEEFEGVNFEPINDYLPLEPKSSEEIIEFMATGAADTDEAIATWAATKGSPFLQAVWNNIFTANGELRFDEVMRSDEGADAALLVFLVCKRLYDNPPSNTPMALAAYNQMVAAMRDQAALRASVGLESYLRDVRTGSLISRINPSELVVNGEVYDTWIAEGGSDAILYGSALSDRPARYVADINERAPDFKKAWESRNAYDTAKERNNRFARYTAILRGRAEQVMANNMDGIFAAHVTEGQAINKDLPQYCEACRLMDELVSKVHIGDFDNLWLLCTQVICRSAFYFSDAEKILLGIDEACKANKDIEIRQAALVSLIEYVADWAADQIDVKYC